MDGYLELDPRELDDPGVFRDFVPQKRLEFLARAAARLLTVGDQLLANFPAFQHCVHVGVQPGDDIPGRGSGRHETEPDVGRHLGVAQLDEGGDLGNHRQALRAAGRERAQPSALHVRDQREMPANSIWTWSPIVSVIAGALPL